MYTEICSLAMFVLIAMLILSQLHSFENHSKPDTLFHYARTTIWTERLMHLGLSCLVYILLYLFYYDVL